MGSRHIQTNGEQKVERLLGQIQQAYPKRFFFQAEYRIQNTNSPTTKPDFVVVLAEYGVAVIEVKDWLEIIEANQKQVKLRRNDGQTLVEDNPVITAQHYAYDLNDALMKRTDLCTRYQGKARLKFPWKAIAILPNISTKIIQQLESKGIFDKGGVLGKESLENAEIFYQLLKESSPWRFHLERPLNEDTLNALRGVLDPSLVVADRAGHDIGTVTRPQEALIKEDAPNLVPKQETFFETELLSKEAQSVLNNQTIRLVRGVAGSGKTLVLLKRAQFIHEQYPNARILVMTFNTGLRDDLQHRIPQLEVTNFHRICKEIIGSAWHSPQYASGWIRKYAQGWIAQLEPLPQINTVDYIEEEIGWRKDLGIWGTNEYLAMERYGRQLSLTYEKRQLMDQIFQAYWEYQLKQAKRDEDWMDWADVPYVTSKALENPKHPLNAHYDIILIDEAQDFAPSWLITIKRLLAINASLFLCDDPTQSLFRYFSWRQKGIEVVGRTRILRVPFRSTRQINLVAYSVINADPLLSKSDDITHPDLTSKELIDGPDPVLYKLQTAEQERQMIFGEVERLLELGILPHEIAVLCHRKSIVKHYAPLRDHAGKLGGIYVDHFDRMKGLEFKAVLIPELSRIFDHAASAEDFSQLRRKLFTAITRARSILLMSYSADCPLPIELEPILDHVWREAL